MALLAELGVRHSPPLTRRVWASNKMHVSRSAAQHILLDVVRCWRWLFDSGLPAYIWARYPRGVRCPRGNAAGAPRAARSCSASVFLGSPIWRELCLIASRLAMKPFLRCRFVLISVFDTLGLAEQNI